MIKILSQTRRVLGNCYHFSRLRKTNTAFRRHKEEEYFDTSNINDKNFDYFSFSDKVQPLNINKRKKYLKEVQQLYNKNDEKCLEMLREKQEELIIKIS